MPTIPAITPYTLPKSQDLPENTAPWTAHPDRCVLLVHDMQNYFLRPFSQCTSLRNELVANAALLHRQCAQLGVPVAFTAQPGDMTADQRGLLNDFWGPGMRVAPEDREIVDPLTPDVEDWFLTKWRYSAFFSSDLLERMRACGRDQLVICGVYAYVGVLMTAVESFTNDIETFVVADATADFCSYEHRLALDYAAKRCAVVTTTSALGAQLYSPRPANPS